MDQGRVDGRGAAVEGEREQLEGSRGWEGTKLEDRLERRVGSDGSGPVADQAGQVTLRNEGLRGRDRRPVGYVAIEEAGVEGSGQRHGRERDREAPVARR